MKLLYLTRDYTPHDHRFLSALSAHGQTVGFLRLEARGSSTEDRPLPPGVEQLRWSGGTRPARRADAPRLLRELRGILRTFKPDLLHAGPLQTAGLLAALSGFQPLVSMSWGYDLLIDAQRSPLWHWATRFTLRRSTAFVGDCDTIRNLAVQHGMNPQRIVTFPWGVDLHHFSPAASRIRERLGWGAEVSVILWTRGWSSLYGVEEFTKAFARLAAHNPNVRLLMLGGGEQSPLVRRVLAPYIGQVHFPGHVKQADLPDYYRAADLYVSASHSDGSSISLLEAFACGIPALVSDIPGNREWITPEVGALFPLGNAAALADALNALLAQKAALPQMGRAARALAEARANWTQNFPQLLQAYEMALKA
ncbi:MAG: hypothetical protein OHK0052_15430 [Anaerolineales bacterium]